jgi:two-component system cell cycle sensor histidine kinase PleC
MRARARRAMTHAGPLAAVLMLLIVVAAGAWRLERSRLAALDLAARLIELRAGELARRLSDNSITDIQARLEHAFAHGLNEGGIALIADQSGTVRAIWPPNAHGPASLADALGGDPLLTFFADKAGAVRIEAPGRPPAYAALRALDDGRQVALIVSQREMLTQWRADARTLAGLLAAVALVLSGCAAAFHLDARRARATAERAAERRVHLDLALRHGRCGLWSWDLARDRVVCSTSMFELIGAPRSTAILRLKDFAELLHPQDGSLDEIAEAARCGPLGPLTFRRRLRQPDGEWIWVDCRADVVEEPVTRRRALVGIAVDVTDRMREAEISATADQRLRDAIEAISEAFVLWDSSNRLVLCNSKYQDLHRLPPGAARAGTDYKELAKLGATPSVADEISSPPGQAQARSRTYQARLADGRWLQVNERRTRDGGFVSIGADITAIKQHEEELQKSERLLLQTVAQLNQSRRSLEAQAQQMAELAKGYLEEKAKAETANRAKAEFLANMSHELRTPLNAIIGFSDIMQSETLGPLAPKYAGYAGDILASGKSLLKVFDDVLAMSNLESGRIQLRYQKFSAAEVVAASVEDIAEVAREKSVVVSVEVEADASMYADRGAVTRVLNTLARNAVKFAPHGGSVSIGAQTFREQLYFYVEDDGPGIAEHDLARLGQPFEQASQAMANGMKGSGLGLAIARSYAELHGGSLNISSRFGEGTVVLVTIPKTPPGPRAVAVSAVA